MKNKWVELDNESGIIVTEYLDLTHFGLIRVITWDEGTDTANAMSLVKLNTMENNELRKTIKLLKKAA